MSCKGCKEEMMIAYGYQCCGYNIHFDWTFDKEDNTWHCFLVAFDDKMKVVVQ